MELVLSFKEANPGNGLYEQWYESVCFDLRMSLALYI